MAVLDWLCEMVGDLADIQKEVIEEDGYQRTEEEEFVWAIGEELRNRKFSAKDFLLRKY